MDIKALSKNPTANSGSIAETATKEYSSPMKLSDPGNDILASKSIHKQERSNEGFEHVLPRRMAKEVNDLWPVLNIINPAIINNPEEENPWEILVIMAEIIP